MKKKLAALVLLAILFFPVLSFSGVSDAASLMKEKTVSLGEHMIGIPTDVIGLAASTAWFVGEFVIFPFRWVAKPFTRDKSPY